MTQSKPVNPDLVSQLLSELIQMIVTDSEAVEIVQLNADRRTVIILRVAPEDIGKVIGKKGRTAFAIRTMLAAISQNNDHTYWLDIPANDQITGNKRKRAPASLRFRHS